MTGNEVLISIIELYLLWVYAFDTLRVYPVLNDSPTNPTYNS